MKYILVDGKPVHEPDLIKWAKWHGTNENRQIARDEIKGTVVSTVFLGIDHSFGIGPPVLFETMVFGWPLDQEQERYCTLDEAKAGHAEMVRRVKTAKGDGTTYIEEPA